MVYNTPHWLRKRDAAFDAETGDGIAAMKLVTTTQMRALEQASVDAGATWPGLMEQAGWGVAQVVIQLLGTTQDRRILVLIGPGNNGGDGLVAARHLHDAGAHVSLVVWRRAAAPDDANLRRCSERSIATYTLSDDPELTKLRGMLAGCDLVVDALLGAGVSRMVEGDLAALIATVNASRSAQEATSAAAHAPLVVSVDLPTGVASDSGAILGSAIHADVTVATGLVKRGCLQYPGRSCVGTIRLAEIGLTPTHMEAIMSEAIEKSTARALLPARPDDSHKGTFGKVMVVAGSLHYPGAASLATAGAARVGAGLVTLASARSALGGPGRLAEITLRPLPEADWGVLGEAAADELHKHLEGYHALLIGPGIGREEQTRTFLERLLGIETPRQRSHIGFRLGAGDEKIIEKERSDLPPIIIDADALTLLSQLDNWWERLPRERCILTPHPGEMKRLLKVDELESDHVKVAEGAAELWGQVVVLKGATTIVAGPDGHSRLNDGGNAALATAGTGDVLAGAIAGLLAQGLTLFDAATLGVYLHSAAGRLVREELGDAGSLASDLLTRLPLAIKALKNAR